MYNTKSFLNRESSGVLCPTRRGKQNKHGQTIQEKLSFSQLVSLLPDENENVGEDLPIVSSSSIQEKRIDASAHKKPAVDMNENIM